MSTLLSSCNFKLSAEKDDKCDAIFLEPIFFFLSLPILPFSISVHRIQKNPKESGFHKYRTRRTTIVLWISYQCFLFFFKNKQSSGGANCLRVGYAINPVPPAHTECCFGQIKRFFRAIKTVEEKCILVSFFVEKKKQECVLYTKDSAWSLR